MTGAPSGRSARVVKLTCPCRTCTICLLPLPLLLFWLEFCPGSDLLGCGQFLAKWSILPQLKHRLLPFPRLNCGAFGLGPNCCGCWNTRGLNPPGCWGSLNTARWGISLWSSWWSILHQMIPRWLSTRGFFFAVVDVVVVVNLWLSRFCRVLLFLVFVSKPSFCGLLWNFPKKRILVGVLYVV